MGACSIATPHGAATEAGAAAFRAGGTAVDAAIAAAAAVAVAYPHMNAIGGDVMALLRHPDGRVEAINGSGAAPAAVRAGVHAITVPGAVAAWQTLLERGGRRPWASLLEPAIELAAGGVPVAPRVARALVPALRRDAGIAEVFFAGGRPLATGEPLVQPALAATLERIAVDGPAALYTGTVGRALAAGLNRLGWPLSIEDLAAHRTEVAHPLAVTFRGETVFSTPPNSQGHVLLEVLLALEEHGGEPDPALLAHLFAGSAEDRDRHLGDPRAGRVPVERLLSREHARELLAARTPPMAAPRAHGDTIAVVTADDEGGAVSLIQSIFHSFGARVLEPATGILLHNRGVAFSLDPRSPNHLAPGKRPAHTLMPVLVERDGLVGVHGTMGGSAQPQIHTQLLLGLHDGMDPDAALAATRWVLENGAALVERRPEGDAATALAAAGWPVRDLPPLDEEVGHAQLIRREGAGYAAASDPRADGSAVVLVR